ncbi:phage terminase large subunit family protein [Nitrospirillum bahiense]|uniref:Phage terminase large subunit GpA-like protein n=1 Tax=Nitrospirillum amazonense TaxID=28077 RepID=A0A560F1W1_9PROT|nr:terminase gpA endonuclease subunit [Nitrospirillum amazonense]TWB15606.1 phage terminase large subunit GpA-like protein [Nitrospirillum amazonense]
MSYTRPIYDAERAVDECISAAFAPPPKPDHLQWAIDNVEFGTESPFQGAFDPSRFPLFRHILAPLNPDDPARVVVVMKSAQLGGTVLAQIFTGSMLDQAPCSFLYVHPTIDNAKKWAKTKWRPFLKHKRMERFAKLLVAERSKDGHNSTLFQERVDGRGNLVVAGAASPSSLSMISIGAQVQDDLDKWENSREAGDPEAMADSRSKAFDWAKILKISTPLLKHSSRIAAAFAKSTQTHFHVPCPHCGHLQPLEWSNMLACLDEEHPERAHFTCTGEGCGCAIEEHHRLWMVQRAVPVDYNPGAYAKGFYIWTAYSELESWESIARAWLAAKGDPAKEQVFLNDTVGLPYDSKGEAPPWEALRDRGENSAWERGIVPPGALILCIGIDCQGDRLEWTLWGFGRDRRRWAIDRGVIDGNITDAAARAAAADLVRQKWASHNGIEREVDMTAIDGSGHWSTEVLSWAKGNPRAMVVRGSRFESAPPLVQRATDEINSKGKKLRAGIRWWWVGVSRLKGILYELLAKEDAAARGHIAFAQGLGDGFYQQLTGERRKEVKRNGVRQFVWEPEGGQRVEMLDCAIYAEAAAIKVGFYRNSDQAWDLLEGRLDGPTDKAQGSLFDSLATRISAAVDAAPASNKPAANAVRGALESKSPTATRFALHMAMGMGGRKDR